MTEITRSPSPVSARTSAVGHGLLAESRALLETAQPGRGDPSADPDRRRGASVTVLDHAPGWNRPGIDVPDAEAAKTAQVAARCWSVLGSAGFTRTDAIVGCRRRRDHRPGRLRRRDLAARRAADHRPDVRARHGRRRGRRQDRDQHPRGQEPGRRVLGAARGGLRPRPARRRCRGPNWSRVWPRWSSAASSPTR